MRDRSTTPLRALLRDTVLHVALLAGGAQMPALHFWRARCITLVEDLMQAMRDTGYRDAEIDEASLAQCVLLDDVTLRALPPTRRNEWTRELLLTRFHPSRDGVAAVTERIGRVLRNPEPSRDWLELYRIVLEPGFAEGTQGDRQMQRKRIADALAAMWRDEPSATTSDRTVRTFGSGRNDNRRRFAAGAAVLVLVAAAIWFMSDRHVGEAMKRMTAAASIDADPAAGESR
ncbi:type VI secretion system protein ImpK [Paraburkholderia caballeronis]|uniref:Type VI secretion system protein ImpK n=1 Tax=Paraburkholderia caballeronis TaxID=416943 RepID=A0A1H7FQM5_9BURK|nr:type VI secretion system protein ImpK [Paraburkholderia caballeronis]PXX00663.1 type VI secretion system protein ImpK [Paraburkholderia caballeronis]RAJ98726.1 type VI secretion system protein ImpK [Paraburkholderia caballeronis]TDV16457.1 type VI secretion system protein ImpK [Paraburkholderia caballeronis]TDV18853.1 type VI secretion system protein ImpK [Paraburkholderia caballeronis]